MATLAKQKVTELQKAWVKAQAERLGCSEAEIVRRLIQAAVMKGDL